ncbi:uncharacterized protein BHQ10_010166 [Talaromyces amestolkiae]|uniref:Major facilitator superfamily (MFS) profile domain-containing protein n=1 Tax=Talaromyces amestolkiae TaxID=1196081 RepID=A0A364LEA5_TALAM|nr:uncharacterized protein BHQ10_010166 [Talaromyces amestolkiae]RAO74154.1 hypothetical protein BHQ10_010166 [Talaromyces amestolkiae]
MEEKNLEAASAHVEEAGKDAVEQGRRIQDEERELSVWKTIQLHPMAILACSAAFTAALNFGYDSISNGSTIAMPSFIIYFGADGSLPSIWTSLWVSMTSLLQAIGAVAGGPLCDRIGRKWPGVIAGLISLVGTAVLYTAKGRVVLLVGKMICGLAIGISMAVGMTYASEVAPFRLRNSVQASFVLFMVLMQCLSLGIVRIFVPYLDQQAFRNVFAIQWGPGALMLIAFLLAPENLLISLQTSFIQASGWPIATELSSYRLRAKTLSIGVVSQTLSAWVTQFVVPYIYNVDSGDLGARTAFPFAGLSFLMILVVFFYVPDTMGLSTEEIDQLYEDKVSARQFKSYVGR